VCTTRTWEGMARLPSQPVDWKDSKIRAARRRTKKLEQA
jgi:hypothetical protein